MSTLSPKRIQQDIELSVTQLLREQEAQMERIMGERNFRTQTNIFYSRIHEAVQELCDELATCIEETEQ